MRAAEVDHRLDGEDHAGLQLHVVGRLDVMQDGRRVVEDAAEAVAAEIAHHRAALAFGEGLDRGADVVGRAARADRRDAAHHAPRR